MSSLARLCGSASAAACRRRSVLQQTASSMGKCKAVSTSPPAASATATATARVTSALSVPAETSARNFVVGGSCGLLRPHVLKPTTAFGQAAQCRSTSFTVTRGFVAWNSGLSRCRREGQGLVTAAGSGCQPPLPSLLLPKLVQQQQQQRCNWGYQQQRGMMSAAKEGGGGAKGGAGGV